MQKSTNGYVALNKPRSAYIAMLKTGERERFSAVDYQDACNIASAKWGDELKLVDVAIDPTALDEVLLDPSATSFKAPLSKGWKDDKEKLRYDLLPPEALEEIVKVLTFGAKKYAPENWRMVSDADSRYFAAAMRHLWAWKRGEENDPETGYSHLSHALCCLMFLEELTGESND